MLRDIFAVTAFQQIAKNIDQKEGEKEKQINFSLLSSVSISRNSHSALAHEKPPLHSKDYQFKSNCRFLSYFPVENYHGHVISLVVDWFLSGQGRMS